MVRFAGLPAELFAFYRGLSATNTKAYWAANRAVYNGPIRDSLLALAEELEPDYGSMKLYRPNRDVRFGADKSPYRLYTGLYREIETDLFYYVNIDGEGMLTGAGLHTQNGRQTAAFRQAVDAERSGTALVDIIAALMAKGFDIDGETVATRPRGVPADHPRLDLMRHKSLNGRRLHPAGDLLHTRRAIEVVRADWQALAPLNDWLSDQLAHARDPASR